MKKKQFQKVLMFTAAALTLFTLSAANPIWGQISESGSSGYEQESPKPDHKDKDNGEPGISLLNDKKGFNNNNA
ncbi:hypothetical protein D7X48_08140 [bacterium D16-50]|jgi:hypothetical protein|nr:hypothetical protein [Lachnospiraceae bacterium]RKJ20700.1 hypothetical protein D7X48_08140 [bacterium D16-50]